MAEKHLPRNSNRSDTTKSYLSSITEEFGGSSSFDADNFTESETLAHLTQRRMSLILGLRLVLETRDLCRKAHKQYRAAARVLENADKSHRQAKRQAHRSHLRDSHSASGGLSGLKETYYHGQSGRCRKSARTKALAALEEMKKAYTLVHTGRAGALPENNNHAMNRSENDDDEAMEVVRFLKEFYQKWMKHIGTGLLPAIRDEVSGSSGHQVSNSVTIQNLQSDIFLGLTISSRQEELLTTVGSRIREDLAVLDMTFTETAASSPRKHQQQWTTRTYSRWSLRPRLSNQATASTSMSTSTRVVSFDS